MIIAQISDTHITINAPDADQRMRDFALTVADINALDPAPDAIVHSGDIVHGGKPLRFLADLVGIDRIMLGTDYSFPPADLTPMRTLQAAGFSAPEVEQIAEGNSRRIFGIT